MTVVTLRRLTESVSVLAKCEDADNTSFVAAALISLLSLSHSVIDQRIIDPTIISQVYEYAEIQG